VSVPDNQQPTATFNGQTIYANYALNISNIRYDRYTANPEAIIALPFSYIKTNGNYRIKNNQKDT
jgi:hypothetical protein